MVGEIRGDVKNILEQTTKTNGRVSKLRDDVDGIEIRNALHDGQMKVWGMIVLTGASVGAWILTKLTAYFFNV